MDFIDFDSFQEGDELPQPQPALSLPNIENFGKKFTNLNNLTRNLLRNKNDEVQSKEEKLAERYATMSLSLIEKEEQDKLEESHKHGQSEDKSSMVGDEKNSSTLSTRLSRVLTNPMSDNSIRDIFTSLEVKISNTDDLVEPGIIGSMSRKALRSEIENDLIKSQGAVLKEYSTVYKSFAALENKLQKLNECHSSMVTRLDKGYESTVEINEQVQNLINEKKAVALKKQILITFKNKFTLNEYEEHLLRGGEINSEFFSALEKAELIHENCSILLSSDNPQLGLKIMAKTNNLVTRGVDRITSFCNKTLGNLHSLNTKSRLVTLHQCLKYLSNRPNYLNTILTNFTESRSKMVVEEFLDQIDGDLERKRERSGSVISDSSSSTGAVNNSRPIVLSAHDPVRFIGDLLAYVHSVVVNEHETIENIFNDSSNVSNTTIDNIVASVLKSLVRPIKTRIDQIINSESKIATIYSIHGLLELYSMMFTKQTNNSESPAAQPLIKAFDTLAHATVEKITNIIQSQLLTIKHSNQAQLDINTDLQAPEWIIEFYSDILPVLDNISSTTIMNVSEEENKKLTSMLVNEPIEIFNTHIQNNLAKVLDKRDQLIIRANFLDIILSKITPITVLNDKVLELSEAVNFIGIELTKIQTLQLYEGCNLTNYTNVINMICPFTDDFFDVSIYQAITENKFFTKELVNEVNESIQEFLPTALLDVQQQLLKINSPMLVNDIVTNSSIEFVQFYLKFGLICEEYLGEKVLTWSDMDVATLLGVETSYESVKSRMEL
ncbi:conserved oligomeric Golgi complex subunit 6 [[Candida] anglica]|uniref:Conserved oligomeric Golgi complex subunit 6 n=1 Tax=[Candida] anglica TaxID=148631 RepID=A0ABP0EJF7_9ASCO